MYISNTVILNALFFQCFLADNHTFYLNYSAILCIIAMASYIAS